MRKDLVNYWRFLRGLPSFFQQRILLESARQTVRQRLQDREHNFLCLLERGIYGHPQSPYLPLLRHARCEWGDLRQLVRTRGLEATLQTLRESGVYITFEEFKGRTPIVRSGQEIPLPRGGFDNPYLSRYYCAETGGTTGAGTRTAIDLEHLEATAPFYKIAYAAHGLEDLPVGMWRSILPSSAGINNGLRASLLGSRLERWFTPVCEEDLRPSWKYRAATGITLRMARWAGAAIPQPEYVPLDEAAVIARWASEKTRLEGGCLIRAFVSLALRISLAAQAEGIDLRGVFFMGGGEPLTVAKLAGITASGACFVPTYVISEVGPVGVGCVHPREPNDLHFSSDSLALIQALRKVPNFDLEVPAFYFTTLLPTAPKLLLNVESDDYGLIDSYSCGCPLEECGWNLHLLEVRSFRKLTGEGMTLVGSEMIRILEEKLPARFGGTPLDYQLIEQEDEMGFTRLCLVVSPNLQLPSNEVVLNVFWNLLAEGSPAADLAQAIWRRGDTLSIQRRQPVWTSRGKLLPLHLIRK
jgi:hypothetical protein